jgi:hypothetical protein
MFKGLKQLKTTTALPPEPAPAAPVAKTKIGPKTLRAQSKQMRLTARIVASLSKTATMAEDFSNLRLLRAVIKTQGLNKALMLFANPGNKTISQLAKNIPSNESLDAVSIGRGDRRTKAALEGLDESIQAEPKLIADWTRASADDIGNLLESVEQQLKDLGEAISQGLECLEGAEDFDEATLAIQIEALPAEAALARINALLDVLPDMDAIISDPCDRDAMDIHKEKTSQMVDKIGTTAGLSVDEENDHHIVSGPISDDYLPRTATLGELGYTREALIELLKKSDCLVDELNGLVERKEQVVGHFNETADNIEQIDNTVPPAVDGAIDADEGEENPDQDGLENADGLTQADMYHCQASSHLYSIAVVVGVSTSAVQEILCIVDEVDDDEDEEDATVVLVQGDPTE